MSDAFVEREAIRDLLTRYTYNGDRGRVEQLAACFAEDGVLEYPLGRGQGPDGVLKALTSGKRDGRQTFVRHHITNPMIDVEGDSATVRSYFAVYNNTGPDHSGTYDDKLVRTAQGWRFAHRRVRVDWQAETSLYPKMTTR